MHGRIFWQMRDFVEARYGRGSWVDLLKTAGIQDQVYLSRPYPDSEAVALLDAVSTMTGKPLAAVLQEFGEFAAPSLLTLYGHLIKPEWRTLDVIEHAEGTAHGMVRREEPGSAPPYLRTQRCSPRKLLLIYNSPRKMCSFAVGLGIGMGKHFQETLMIRHRLCMQHGDDQCEILFETLESPVQAIRPK